MSECPCTAVLPLAESTSIQPTTLYGTDHIPITFGRDYGDVARVKDMFLGGVEPVFSVSADLSPDAYHVAQEALAGR